jgi:hypothetical protein
MNNMLDILKNFDEAEKGNKPAAAAEVGSMKAILESIQTVDECGDMPMEMPTQMPQQGQPVTVSVTASGKDNVADLISLMQQAAGIEQHIDMPMSHSHDMDIEVPAKDQEMDMATMRQIMAAGDKESEPEMDMEKEEWDNAPDEDYGSVDDVLAVGDDLNRPKDKKAIRAKDPAMESLAEELKASLRKALEEKKSCSSKRMKAKEGEYKNDAQRKAVHAAKSKKKNESDVDEAHGNSKVYDKCWDGYEKVPGKKRGEPGSCRKK